ncbi:MAG: hypothetical protein IJ777_02930 [Clostridia bacterium]|nr:hypothetical protein [Clostridia bacterium]
MANGKRNREASSSGVGTCVKMHLCKLNHCGGTRCAKNKCQFFADPKDPKNRKYMILKKASKIGS